jgi:hypothetical protein
MVQQEHAEADHHQADFAKHFEGSTLQFTEKGLFGVEMVIPDKRLAIGINKLDLIVHDRDHGDIEGATVTVTPWMPEMGHGAFSATEVAEKGGGLYSIGNIVMIMGGHWEMRVDIKKGDLEDRVVFDFPLIRSAEPYEYIRVKSPAGYDAVIGSKNPLEELAYEMVATPDGPVKVFRLTVKDIGFERQMASVSGSLSGMRQMTQNIPCIYTVSPSRCPWTGCPSWDRSRSAREIPIPMSLPLAISAPHGITAT